jgi:DNA repair protein RadC
MRGAFDESPVQESVWVIAVNRRNKPIARSMVTLGTSTSTLVAPSDVFRYLILQAATGFILSHNHPSGVMPYGFLCRIGLSAISELLHLDAA